MNFYLDAGILDNTKVKFILEDYAYWFYNEDNVIMHVFFHNKINIEELISFYNKIDKKNKPNIKFEKNMIPFDKLRKYYDKQVLVNEMINYKRGDLFRIFKLVNPLIKDIDFENQPISIQYDIQYDKYLPKEKRSYYEQSLKPVIDIIEKMQPKSILDAGCGTGSNYYYLQKYIDKTVKYKGFDFSRYNIIKAIDYYGKDNVDFEIGDITDINIKEKFEFAFTESTMPFVNDPINAVKEMYRMTEKGFCMALYTTEQKVKDFDFNQKSGCYELGVGSTWKFYKDTPNTFYLPRTKNVLEVLDTMKDKISYRVNDFDQFFWYFNIKTSNVFIYPKEWYEKNKNTFKEWNEAPLM